jgi:hypothetical protein
MAQANKPNNKKPRVMDVTHPGKAAPSPTSKPIIVNHHPLMPDPMVNLPSADTTPDDGEKVPVLTTRKTRLQPLSAPEIDASPEEEPKKTEELATADNNPLAGVVSGMTPPKPEEKPEEPVLPEPVVVPEPTVEKPSLEPVLPAQEEPKQPEKTNATESAKPEMPASPELFTDNESKDQETFHDDQSKPPMTTADDEVEKVAIREAAIHKLADSRTYFLKINSVEKQRTKRFVILGIVVSILLALAWVDIALDAGIIKLGGLKPVTHLFSN